MNLDDVVVSNIDELRKAVFDRICYCDLCDYCLSFQMDLPL